MVGGAPPKLGKWLVRCFKEAGDAAVFHGFGITSWPLLKDFRWYSADSSSWGYGFRFGKIPLFDDTRGRIHRARLGNAQDCYSLAHLYRAMGFDPTDFADRSRNDPNKICAISAMCYMMAERWLRRRWGDVGIPGDPGGPTGPLVHLADANPNRYGNAIEGGAGGPKLHLSDTSSGINFGRAAGGLPSGPPFEQGGA